jgi:hypothetical protein
MKTIITFAAAAAALMATTALASTPAAPPAAKHAATPQQVAANELPPASNVAPAAEASAAPGPTYSIAGFRTATFGMSEEQVKAAIAHDFGVPADKVQSASNVMQHTNVLVVQTALPPGPGNATVSYIFGASTHKLIHVNVAWATSATPTAAERSAIITAGAQLSDYFKAQPWEAKAGRPVGLIGNGSGILMFDATDSKGGNVQVEVDNMPLQRTVKGKTETTDPKGAAVLRVSYDQDAAHPDVFQIKAGSF